MINSELYQSGILIERNFLNQNILKSLQLEVLDLFNSPVLNGKTRGSIWENDNYKRIVSPISSIESINLLELLIDIFNRYLNEHNKKNFILTDLQIYEEKNNGYPLYWHTDGRDIIRGQIVLCGGGEKSGGFMYMKNTHKNIHEGHQIPRQILEKNKSDIIDCNANPGDLIIFNAMGFHNKKKCLEKRIVIHFEVQSIDTPVNYRKSYIDFSNRIINKKILDNFHYLRQGSNAESYTKVLAGLDRFRYIYPSFSRKLLFRSIYLYFIFFYKKIINKLKKI